MTTALEAYTYGECTYGMALLFPDIYPQLGNGKEWYDNAKKQGYATTQTPTPGTIVSYAGGNKYSPYGHVAYVESVNPDGKTFVVREMNFSTWDGWDTRVSDLTNVNGFIVPPGANIQLLSDTTAGSQCVTFSWNIFGSNICFDGVVGGLAVLAGVSLVITGLVVIVAFTLRKTNSLGAIPNPKPARKEAQTSKEKNKSVTSQPIVETDEQIAVKKKSASEKRVRVARERAATSENKNTPSEASTLRKEIASTRRERVAANKSGNIKAWNDATVRMNMAQNRLKVLQGGKSSAA